MNTTIISFFKLLISLLAIFSLISCNQESSTQQLEELQESYTKLADKITDKITAEYQAGEERLSNLTDSEIKKLTIIEYKVINLDIGLDSQKMEEKLAELGQDRWNCFHLEKHQTQKGSKEQGHLKAFCKRLPSSHLRTLARISKIVP